MRGFRVGVGALIPVLALLAAADCSPQPAPRPRIDGVRVLQYNMHQGQADGVVDAVVARITKERPTVVTLNEICAEDDSQISGRLQGRYDGVFQPIKPTLHCALAGNQGVSVYVRRGADQPATDATSYDIGQATACLSSTTTPSIRACATHLSSPQDGDPGAEIDALHAEMSRLARTQPTVFAGDLNLDPWEPKVASLYGDFYEVSQRDTGCGRKGHRPVEHPPASCTFHHPTQGWKKIDYVFVDKRHFASQVSASTSDAKECGDDGHEQCSDHRQLWGTARLRGTSSVTGTFWWQMWSPDDRWKSCDPDPDGTNDPARCVDLAWTGQLTVDGAGTITGTGMLSVSSRACIPGGGFQSVHVKGRYDKRFAVTLTFGQPSFRYTGECAKPSAEAGRRWADQVRMTIDFTAPVTASAPLESPRAVTAAGRPYKFGVCKPISQADRCPFD